MKELEIKLNELYEERKKLDEVMEQTKNKMQMYKKMDEYSIFFREYSNLKSKKQYLERKILVLNDAMDILEGVGI